MITKCLKIIAIIHYRIVDTIPICPLIQTITFWLIKNLYCKNFFKLGLSWLFKRCFQSFWKGILFWKQRNFKLFKRNIYELLTPMSSEILVAISMTFGWTILIELLDGKKVSKLVIDFIRDLLIALKSIIISGLT